MYLFFGILLLCYGTQGIVFLFDHTDAVDNDDGGYYDDENDNDDHDHENNNQDVIRA